MNRRDYRAHVDWAEGIKAQRAALPVHHARKPEPMRPRRPWRAWFVTVAAAAVVGACRSSAGF